MNIVKTYQEIVGKLGEYAQQNGFHEAVIGLSGGIDSALTATLAVKALGNENVFGVSMPGPHSTQSSITDAKLLASNLDIEHKTIPIDEIYSKYIEVLTPHFKGKVSDVTEENLQARIRANYLFALSNKFGYLVLATGNKSEAMVGYATLYGDLAGGICPIGDIYKTEVYEMARYINEISGRQLIPVNILEKEPSAELRPGQKDTDSLPPYELLDKILKAKIEKGLNLQQINQEYDPTTVQKVMDLIKKSEFKRKQAPPVILIDKE
ncbi:NAD(+) synthase [Candidatus Woesearchaeota archaeon]|nr:NAD(+) synthase [Candidatus Woesearchaeota archaeon]